MLISEHDEYLYLQESLELGGLELPNIKTLFSPMHGKDPRVKGQPHTLTKVFTGKIANKLKLNILTFNLFLDFIFVFLSFFAFNLVIRKFFDNQNNSENKFISRSDLLTLVFLSLPWLLNPLFAIDRFVLPALDNFTKIQFYGLYTQVYPCVPVLRSINTQASYPLLALAILFLLKGNSLTVVSISGFLSGLLLYVYIFPWFFFPPAAILFLCLKCFYTYKKFSGLLRNIFAYILPFLLTSLPGIYRIINSPLESTYLIPQEAPLYFFISPLLLAVSMLTFFKLRKEYNQPLVFCFSIIISIMIVMNIQPLTGRMITPYHFLTFYFVPFLGTFFVAVTLYLLNGNKLFRGILYAVLSGLFLFRSASTYSANVGNYHESGSDTAELVTYLKTVDLTETCVAMFPFFNPSEHWWSLYPSRRTTPYYIQSMSQKPVFPFNYEFFGDEELLYMNFYVYHLYRGDEPTLHNYKKEEIYYPDYAYGIVSFEAVRRNRIMEKYGKELKDILSKDILPAHVEYIIAEPSLYPALYAYVQEQHEEIWRSSNSRYVVFRSVPSNIQEE